MREFHIGDILSVTTGYLVSPSGMGGVYEILNYMVGESLFTHQLPRAGNECAPALREQHPDIVDADCSGVTEENLESRIAEWVAKYGERRMVAPLARGVYETRDPIDELRAMTDAEVIVVGTGEVPR